MYFSTNTTFCIVFAFISLARFLKSPIWTAVCHLSSPAISIERTHCNCRLHLGSNCSRMELEKIFSFSIVELKSENSECPVVKDKITVVILTNSRLKIIVNSLQQKYLHVLTIMLE